MPPAPPACYFEAMEGLPKPCAARIAAVAASIMGAGCVAAEAAPDENTAKPSPNAAMDTQRGDEAVQLLHEESNLPVGIVEVETGCGDWIPVKVEIAATRESKTRGLMHREKLPEGHGMLFVFRYLEVRAFWMKNTLIPLDMIFIGAGGRIVGIVHEAEPLSPVSRSVGIPSRYVLEVRGGWAAEKGVGEGHRVRFEGISGVAEPFGQEK